MDRRTLILAGATGALLPARGAEAGPPADAITATTIREAQKLHGVSFPAAAEDRLAPVMAGQLAGVKAIRAVPRPRDLQPAFRFDPRLPGKAWPSQPNRVRLSKAPATPLPASDEDIAFAGVTELSAWIKAGKLSSARLTGIYLDRIVGMDRRLNAWITVAAEQALSEAHQRDAELEAGKWRGPLHGIPYGLKDCFDTKGLRTTWGSSLFEDRVPDEDAAIVTLLRDAGAVLLGKLGLGELANGATWFGGEVKNPWNLAEPSGGSSAGSGSATAAGLCAFAIGTDSLGSILNPADRCGVVGLRATFGRVPVEGGMPLTPTLERIGPLCRRVEDAALVLAAINGPDPTSANSFDEGFAYDAGLDLRSLKVGWSPKWFETTGFGGPNMPAVAPACRQALETVRALGVELVEVDLPPLPYMSLLTSLYVEAGAIFEDLTLSGDDGKLIAPWADGWRQGRLFSAIDYFQAERFRRQVMEMMDALLTRTDMLIAPTYGSFELFLAANFTGHPGLNLRCGFTESGTRGLSTEPLDPHGPKHRVPCSISLHGRLFQEGPMLALARALEQRLDVWRERPPIA